ncbi:MAG: DUF1254 domain-containing protein, partial [Hyphomicrobiaceae bacterium]|nr:DUF1254 domain-containing protein [Hyphomicrobiaceae bacterium]
AGFHLGQHRPRRRHAQVAAGDREDGMPVMPVSMDELRQRLPQLLARGLGQLTKWPFRVPERPLAGAVAGWLSWRTVAAAVLIGGIVHIGATLFSSLSATGQAYRQLAEKLPVNSMTVLALQAPGRQILPFLPPDALYAMCRYDLSGGPVAVSASVLEAGWALSVHSPDGTNVYVVPGQRQRRTEVSFLLVPSEPDTLPVQYRESTAESQIASPTLKGLVILRAPLRGLAWTAETEAVLQRASCKPAPR